MSRLRAAVIPCNILTWQQLAAISIAVIVLLTPFRCDYQAYLQALIMMHLEQMPCMCPQQASGLWMPGLWQIASFHCDFSWTSGLVEDLQAFDDVSEK